MARNTRTAVDTTDNTDVSSELLTLGNVDPNVLTTMGFEEIDPLRGLDVVVNAGKPGFEIGTTKVGYFRGTKLCVSTKEKKRTWRAHPNQPGKVARKLHLFQAVEPKTGELIDKYFGIWSAGVLDAALERIKPDQILAVTYTGPMAEAFRAGETPAHGFTIRGRGLKMEISDLQSLLPYQYGEQPMSDIADADGDLRHSA